MSVSAMGIGGGAGARVTMTNAVTGRTAGGTLSLRQSAFGGAGGSGNGAAAGIGGGGASNLTFDDTHSTTRSASVTASVSATGGAGGASLDPDQSHGGFDGAAHQFAGAGGAATSTNAVTGRTVSSYAKATGGAPGAGPDGGVAPGQAAATATASAKGVGISGKILAAATSDPGAGDLVRSLSATARGVIAGSASAKAAGSAYARTAYSSTLPGFATTRQALAIVTALPARSDANAVLAANANIGSAFGQSADYFAIGEIGGSYDTGGTRSETISDTISMTIDPSKLATARDLTIGLYDETKVGSGFTKLSLTIAANGHTLATKSFTTAAAVQAYFTDHPLDLGRLTSLEAGAESI